MKLVHLIPLLPLIGFLTIGIFNKKLPKTLVPVIGSGVILGAFGIVLTLLLKVISGELTSEIVPVYEWISFGDFQLNFAFLIDPLSVWMMSIITGVGFLIHLYSASYMSHDEGYARYFAYLNLFVFSMLLLVMGNNYVVMFAGWEGVGLCSYLLIGFWFKNTAYNNAAKKAFIMNRVGDLGFLLGMLLIFVNFGSLDFNAVFESAQATTTINSGLIVAITLLLFVGATGKSAQLPLYTWLPDAMAGPTPVSALIHAATMVTAGIYMIVRSNVLFSLAPTTLTVIMIIGIATAIFAATIGLVQNDIKKVLAYSTVSQLGYMFFALGLGAYTTGMFHVTTHAFFKALLFLGAGSVIHAVSNEQDIRKMGGLRKYMPITFITFGIATLAIAGIPPFAGFFSKDEILANAWAHSPILWALGVLGALLTTFYMFRIFFLTFFGEFRGTDEQKSHLHESPIAMTLPLMVLAVLSIAGGFIGIPHVFGGHNWFATYLSPLLGPNTPIHEAPSHATEFALMGVSTGLVVLTIIFAYITYVSKRTLPLEDGKETSPLHKLLYNKYYVDELYDLVFVKTIQWKSKMFERIIENAFVDAIVNGVGKIVLLGGKGLRLSQTGSLSAYLFAMVVGIVALLVIKLVL